MAHGVGDGTQCYHGADSGWWPLILEKYFDLVSEEPGSCSHSACE